MEKIGFVGTGAMGSALLSRLKLASVAAIAFDIASSAMEAARKEGAETAPSAKAVAQASTIIDVVVRTDQEVIECTLGKDGILEGATPGSLGLSGADRAVRPLDRLPIEVGTRMLVCDGVSQPLRRALQAEDFRQRETPESRLTSRNPAQQAACPRQESNLRTRFRKPLLSPLSYEGRGPRTAEEENVAANSPRPTILRHTDDSLASSAGAVRGAHEGQTKCKYEGFCFALRA